MSVTLPDDLRDVLELVGIDWPDLDEDELRDTAREYREFSQELLDTVRDANKACSNITAGKSKGIAVDAFKTRWGKVSGQDMKNLASAVDILADAMDTGAGYVTTCKYVIIADLTAAAATITGSVIAAFFTGGLTALIGAAAAAALKLAVREAIDLLIQQLVDLAVEKIEAQVLSKLEGLFDDEVSSGGRGTDGKLLPEGSDAMGQDLWIEFAEFADAIDQLGKEHGRFKDKKSKFDGKREKRSLVSKKDDRFSKFGTAIDKAEEKVESTTVKMSKELEKNVTGLDKTKRSNDSTDKDIRDRIGPCDYKKLRRGDDVPMYLLAKDGSVQELTSSGKLKPVDATDDSGIQGLLQPNGKAWRPSAKAEKDQTKITQNHPGKVTSTKVNAYNDRLGHATQLARKARGDYKTSNNYASGYYVDPTTGKRLILVGYSQQGLHSERSIGYPLMNKGKEAGLQTVFTERAPCQKGANCERWLDKYFASKNPSLEVLHSADYNSSVTDGKVRNKPHSEYIEGLKKNHGK
ncbi:nucleic acid/nucleotide deaminase domain-containing protein [Streptomyces scopuliridis]|uniref:WXG100-like domain-containing protein n=1 Tax=Streptomyces scopuliridis TaxID=452529 RepID=UPI00368CB217